MKLLIQVQVVQGYYHRSYSYEVTDTELLIQSTRNGAFYMELLIGAFDSELLMQRK